MNVSRPSPQTHGRLASLDLLRAVAVLLVLGRHMPRLDDGTPGVTLLRLWQRGGWIGVDLFFVLSGFLVSGLLFREVQQHGRLRIGHFLIRRGLKIYPAFYLMIAVTVVVRGVGYVPALVCELLFVQNHGPAIWSHTWSLAVEEHFYVSLALLFAYLSRDRSGWTAFAGLPRIALGIAAACLLLRGVNVFFFNYQHSTHLYPTALRVDSLFFGVLLAYFFHDRPAIFMERCRRWRRPLLAAGLALLAPPFVIPLGESLFVPSVGLTLLYLGSGAILCALLAGGPPGPVARPLTWIGSHSYSIYLWHLPVDEALKRSETIRALSAPAYNAVYLVTTIVFGWALARLVEWPVLALRDRWWPSRSGSLTAARRDAGTRP